MESYSLELEKIKRSATGRPKAETGLTYHDHDYARRLATMIA